jgi:protein-disulfide isomerase
MDIQTNNETSAPPAEGNNLSVPISIVIAGGLIAFAIYSSPGKAPTTAGAGNNNANAGAAAANVAGAVELKPVSTADHILGNPDAPVKIVEFSDLECPFCKRFHETMQQVMNDYGKDGKVAWVYRQMPLDSLHSKARNEAIATECAGKLGGNEKFWAYVGKIFEVTPSNNGLDPALLPKIASDIGLNRSAFEQCLSGNDFTQFITDSVNDAAKAGAQGTPYSIVITKSGKQFPINGALPYTSVKQTIDSALAEK